MTGFLWSAGFSMVDFPCVCGGGWRGWGGGWAGRRKATQTPSFNSATLWSGLFDQE